MTRYSDEIHREYHWVIDQSHQLQVGKRKETAVGSHEAPASGQVFQGGSGGGRSYLNPENNWERQQKRREAHHEVVKAALAEISYWLGNPGAAADHVPLEAAVVAYHAAMGDGNRCPACDGVLPDSCVCRDIVSVFAQLLRTSKLTTAEAWEQAKQAAAPSGEYGHDTLSDKTEVWVAPDGPESYPGGPEAPGRDYDLRRAEAATDEGLRFNDGSNLMGPHTAE